MTKPAGLIKPRGLIRPTRRSFIAGAAASLLAAPAIARRRLPQLAGGAGGGGGGGSYVAKAVHFDDSSFLRIAGLSSADSPFATYCTFFRVRGTNPGGSAVLIDFYPAGDEDVITITGDGAIYMGFDNNGAGHLGGMVAWSSANGLVPLDEGDGGAWHSLLISFDFDHPQGSKNLAVMLDRTLLAPFLFADSSGEAFPFAFNAAPVGTPDTTEDYPTLAPMDLSVYQLFVGTKIVQSDNTILSADVANFLTSNNKPVDPAVAALAYGTQSVLYAGDSVGFATNQGNGGSSSLTGALTNATTSPSD